MPSCGFWMKPLRKLALHRVEASHRVRLRCRRMNASKKPSPAVDTKQHPFLGTCTPMRQGHTYTSTAAMSRMHTHEHFPDLLLETSCTANPLFRHFSLSARNAAYRLWWCERRPTPRAAFCSPRLRFHHLESQERPVLEYLASCLRKTYSSRWGCGAVSCRVPCVHMHSTDSCGGSILKVMSRCLAHALPCR